MKHYCNGCKTFFGEPKLFRESHGEIFGACPVCASDWYDGAKDCPCGELISETKDYCVQCMENTQIYYEEMKNKIGAHVTDILVRMIEGE